MGQGPPRCGSQEPAVATVAVEVNQPGLPAGRAVRWRRRGSALGALVRCGRHSPPPKPPLDSGMDELPLSPSGSPCPPAPEGATAPAPPLALDLARGGAGVTDPDSSGLGSGRWEGGWLHDPDIRSFGSSVKRQHMVSQCKRGE